MAGQRDDVVPGSAFTSLPPGTAADSRCPGGTQLGGRVSTAMLLNPAVAKVQRRVPRRVLAVMIVTLWAALVFIGLAAAFGVRLVVQSWV